MAGQKLIIGQTASNGRVCGGLPLVTVVENGSIGTGDEWALFRMTDLGLGFYNEGPDFRAGIMAMQGAVVEVHPRHTTEEKATVAWRKLSETERARTLIRSVRPVK